MQPESPTARAAESEAPESFLLDPSSFLLGAYVGEVPVGLAWGLQMRSPTGRLTSYVHELEVHQDWRRQGIGSALIAEAMALARQRSSTRFWLSTGGHNEAAWAGMHTPKGASSPRLCPRPIHERGEMISHGLGT